ncbi:MAG: HAD family hydrolase [Anaerolineales bacterium]|jgi:phosphoglycolate phosphatase
MSDFEHIIWDFNGTLMDDAWLCIDVMNEMLNRRGLLTLPPDRYADIFDFPVKNYYLRAGWDLSQYPFEMLSDEFMAGYHARKLECKLRPEAQQVLAKVHEKGIPQSIISAAQQSMVEELLDHYNIAPYFENVRGLDNHHAAGKTEVGLQLVEDLGIDPEHILMVGDTVHDFEVAEDMGVNVVLISSGHQARARLVNTRMPVVDKLDEIKFT